MVLSNTIVLLNAPKGAGKDTIGIELQNLYGCQLRAFKTKLYEIAYPFTKGLSYVEFLHYCTDRELKEKRSNHFWSKSPRDFLIFISERIVKPHFGKNFFGLSATESISAEDFNKGVVFTDSGFEEEALPLVKDFGGRNVFIVQFTGQGVKDFGNDSRGFINIREARTIRMSQPNEGISPEKYAMLIAQEVIRYG